MDEETDMMYAQNVSTTSSPILIIICVPDPCWFLAKFSDNFDVQKYFNNNVSTDTAKTVGVESQAQGLRFSRK